jgi:hypothetical protein
MAAVSLLAGSFPVSRRVGGVPTTLQQFNLPPRTRTVKVRGVGALWVQFSGADGGAVDLALAVPTGAAQWIEFAVAGTAPAIFVAAQSGTSDVYVVAER